MVSTAPRRSARSRKPREVPPAAVEAQAAALGAFPPPTAHSEELAANNLKIAAAEASRLAASTGIAFEDLYPVALIGLLKGCRRYDPERVNPGTGRPYRLSSIAVPFIRGALWQWLRKHGHRSGVRWPDAWRDRAPVVRRLVAEGADLAAVAEAVGLPEREVDEILRVQAPVHSCDPDAQGFSCRDPELADDLEIGPELQQALEWADEAHCGLEWADRLALELSWCQDRRRTLIRLPFGQFIRNARALTRGQRLPERASQQDLSLELPAIMGSGERIPQRITRPQEIVAAVQQLALFDVGKTAAAEQGPGGAADDQPSQQPRQPAELPAPAVEGGAAGAGSGRRLLGSAAQQQIDLPEEGRG
jgi:DNA-directed RNA polymerase specialized sigma subunit